MENICIVYATASNKEEAEKIGKELVSMRLAACVNVLDNITSFYRWEGREERAREAELVIKTRESLLPKLEEAIKELHSYSCPCVMAVPACYVSEDYAKWVIEETDGNE